MKILRVILGNQLFPISQINLSKDVPIFMAEDSGLCSYIKHHKSKIALFFSAMRSYRDQLKNNSYKVIYNDANNYFSTSYFEKLFDVVKSNKIKKIEIYEIEDKPFEKDFLEFCETNNIEITKFQNNTTPFECFGLHRVPYITREHRKYDCCRNKPSTS